MFESGWRLERTASVASPSGSSDTAITNAIIGSLTFERLGSRERRVAEPSDSTYQWIFNTESADQSMELGEGTHSWDSFTGWLRSNSDKLYWITGKAGSGKSTLMKYIIGHEQLREGLGVWSEDLPLLISHYYFWDGGSDPLQKSLEGMLRTLLYQALRGRPDLVRRVCRWRWDTCQFMNGAPFTQREWEFDELREVVNILASESGRTLRLALFIDGLDEFNFGEGRENDIIDLIKSLQRNHDVKICVSSRPWTKFRNAFHRSPSLTMQELTSSDIAAYIGQRFEACQSYRDLQTLFPTEAEELRTQISHRAEGVFLWVHVVTGLLVDEMENYSIRTFDRAEEILSDLPTDMGELYTRMWSTVRPADLATSSRLIRLVLASYVPLDTETYCRAEGLRLPQGPIVDNARSALIAMVRAQFHTYTRGLVEVDDNGLAHLIHRTVKEWANRTDMNSMMISVCPDDFDPYLSLVEAGADELLNKQFDPDISLQFEMFEFVARVMSYASEVSENQPCAAFTARLTKALDRLDQVATEVANRHKEPRLSNNMNHGQSNSSFCGGDQYSRFHWSKIQSNGHRGENPFEESCFASLAAQFCISSYVKAAVFKSPELLEPSAFRLSLLECTIFSWKHATLRKTICRGVTWQERIQPVPRLQLVKFLLSKGQKLSEESVVSPEKKLIDIVKMRIATYERAELWELRDYYARVLEEGSRPESG